MLRAITLCLCTLFAATATAQERPRAILVMDGSGSMWGQIDGKAKITIAQEVVGTVLGTIPETQELGLTLYGHRRKGDCTDIETVVQPGTGTKPAIQAAVNGVSPKGKTPMTEAVRQAAEALKYTEEKATVILVSDGIETCDPDPCAAAAALEQAGVDFTAHVVGFDVSEAEALRQMQCIADETGGQFIKASNAAELADAMVAVVEVETEPAPAPEPTLHEIRFRATAGEGGIFISETLAWEITQDGAPVGGVTLEAAPTLSLADGAYRVTATRPSDEVSREADFTVTSNTRVVTVVFPAPPVSIRFQAIDGKHGPRISEPLVWDLFRGEEQIEGPLNVDGFTAELEKGEYRVTVMRPADEASAEAVVGVGKVNKTVTVELPEYKPAATLDAAASAPAGDTIPVRWTGPEGENDTITVGIPGNGNQINYAYIRDGSPLDLEMPPEPGTYELRYILREGNKVLATRPIEITPVEASITAPEALPAGSSVQVRWTGPDYKNDHITIARADHGGMKSEAYSYTREGSPLDLQLPAEPGAYELRYIMNQDRTILAAVPVEVTAVSATITPPAELPAGSSVKVSWEGPDDSNDFIAIFPEGEDSYAEYTYTREGSPLDLTLPSKPGKYRISYVQNVDRTELASVDVEVTAVSASITPPAELPAGGTVKVGWQGPDDHNDFIAIFPEGEDRYTEYTYTREGSPLDLTLPAEPGKYRIAYVQNVGRNELASVPVEVTATSATLTVPPEAPIGSTLKVEWLGPDNHNDYIAIFPAGEDRYFDYAYTSNGTPAEMTVPPTPGAYVVRYVLNVGRSEIAEVPITVTTSTATLTPQGEAMAGGELLVDWEGPDNRQDYIAIFPAEGGTYSAYSYTQNGSPAKLKLPDAPGDYVLKYVLRADNTPIAELPITLK
ncbi:MAG: VWA domain-containing protein [Vannielia sp.]|uniref:vWA domain-containing protein n=1 Tax=Vannielia sp. TaxID=2813045 RepID=UPI003B8BE294